jgi:hypothetical protein
MCVFQRICKILEGGQQIIKPKKRCVDSDPREGFALFGIHHSAHSSPNLFGGLRPGQAASGPRCAEVTAHSLEGFLYRIWLGKQKLISAHILPLKAFYDNLYAFERTLHM